MRWTLAPVTLTALLATSAAADECAVYRAAIDDLSATRPTFEAVDLAIKFAARAMSAANETREPSNSASALMPAFNAARATVRASGDVFQYVDMIADGGGAAGHVIASAQAASIETHRSAQVAVHEITYLLLCLLGERA